MANYLLFSQEKDQPIMFFEKFDHSEIKKQIIEYLQENKKDVLELCKEYSKKDIKRFYGNEIIGFYQNVNETPCKVIMKGTKEYYKPLI